MNQRDIVSTLSGIQRKLADGSEISEADVEQMAKAAAATGRIEHRSLFAEAKRIHRDGPDKPAEPPAPAEPVFKENSTALKAEVAEEHLSPLREKARKTGRIEDRMEYVRVKQIINELTENVEVVE